MDKQIQRKRRIARVRGKISGTASRPRLTVFRSNKYIYAQLIDDAKGVTLASATSKDLGRLTLSTSAATGEKIAENAKKLKIAEVVFDRRGYRYHGRVKALADGARKGGLVF